jgi:hypothetical protein
VPAGIGIVEGAIAVALISTGTSGGVAIPAAVTYRAISCWLPIAVGWMVHTRLRSRPQLHPIRVMRDVRGPAAHLSSRSHETASRAA